MTVKVKLFDRRTDELMQEFSSISKAAEFVKNLAVEKLQRRYTRKYISDLISGAIDCCESVLLKLGIKAERSTKCVFNDCNTQTFSGVCEDCYLFRSLCYICDENLTDEYYICLYCQHDL